MKAGTATLSTIFCLLIALPGRADEAADIVRAAIDHWRGLSSYSEITMTIHRADWERRMSMQAWTKGDERSLVRVTEPARDRGNGTLTSDDNMWTYSPKINRIIKIPSSMMNQSWMGSDFSNKDVARADDLLDQYVHTLIGRQHEDGHVINEIESVPLEHAAVVWGREVLRIREDHVVLEHRFYDQDDVLLKTLVTHEIGRMGDREVAVRQRMQKTETPDEWTELSIDAIEYGIDLPDSLFTLSSLRNPRM